MRVLARVFSLAVLLCTAVFLSGCKKDDAEPNSAVKQQLEKLKGSWALNTVTLDNEVRTDFVDVILTISGVYVSDDANYDYSFTGTFPNPSPWPNNPGGKFTFGSDPIHSLIRLDDLAPLDPANGKLSMTYSVDATTLQISFTYNGAGFAGDGNSGGRTSEVNGEWSFSFTKQQ